MTTNSGSTKSTPCPSYGGINAFGRSQLIALAGVNNEIAWLEQTNLYLNQEKIDYLAPDCFTNLTQLANLDLSENNLSCIDANLFQSLINLRELYLGYNQLKMLDPSTFNSLTSLEELYLNYNQLKSLDPSLFRNLTNLHYLYLNYNELNSLDPLVFDYLTHLTILDLSNNNLITISPTVFESIGNSGQISIYIEDNPVASSNLSSAYFCQENTLCTIYCSINALNRLVPCRGKRKVLTL